MMVHRTSDRAELPDVPEAAVEAVARVEHAYTATFGTPGARHRCLPSMHRETDCPLCDGDGFWTEGEAPSWDDDYEEMRESFREDARRALATALPVLIEQGWTPSGPAYRDLLVDADSLLSLVAYRGASAVDDEWKADAKELISKLRKAANDGDGAS